MVLIHWVKVYALQRQTLLVAGKETEVAVNAETIECHGDML